MFSMKILPVTVLVVGFGFGWCEGFTLGGRFPRESEPENTANKTAESLVISGEVGTPSSANNITMIPLTTVISNPSSESTPITDMEADKFIESLKNQADGTKPREKNETHVSSSVDSGTSSNNSSAAPEAPSNAAIKGADTGANTTSFDPAVVSSNFTAAASGGDTSQPTQGQMFQNESSTSPSSSPLLSSEEVASKLAKNDTSIPKLNETNATNALNESCPSDCSAESCKPECSFHCCLREKSSAKNDSLVGSYQQDSNGNVSAKLAFDSSKLEKMLLDTISEFTQKLPNTQQAQKLSEIMTDPSNHYAYAPSYDSLSSSNNANRYNFMEQMSNPYLARGSKMYFNGDYSNKNNYNNPYGYNNMNQNYAPKSQVNNNPSYPYRRSQISDSKYPIASTHHRTGIQRQNIAQAFLYQPDTSNYQSRRFYRRARIYSPYNPTAYRI